MGRQTLRNWVHRFKCEGPDRLLDGLSKRSEPRLPAEQRAEIAELVETWPGRSWVWCAGARSPAAMIGERFGIAHHERTLGKLFKALGVPHITARPRHPAQDGCTIEAFANTRDPRAHLTPPPALAGRELVQEPART